MREHPSRPSAKLVDEIEGRRCIAKTTLNCKQQYPESQVENDSTNDWQATGQRNQNQQHPDYAESYNGGYVTAVNN